MRALANGAERRITPMTKNTFTNETEAARLELFKQVQIANLGSDEVYRFLSYSGVLPVNLPDGIRLMILPDMHCPAHNVLIWRAINQFQTWFRPHIGIAIGDWNDLLAMSMWPKMPRTVVRPQDEIDESRRAAYKVIRLGAYWFIIIDGNHEDRMIRGLCKLVPQFAHYLDPVTREPIANLHQLMGFQSDDPVTFITGNDERGGFEGGVMLNDDLKLEHGVLVKPVPGDSVRGHAEKWHRNTVTGHTHRMGQFARQLASNKVLRGTELGCLVDWDKPNFAFASGHDWHHGFAVGIVHGGVVHVQPIPIIESLDAKSGQRKYFFTYADQVFVSSDR